MKVFEKHHRQPVAEGGSNLPENIVLLCPACHAHETEKQEQAGCKSAVWLESRFSPRMMQVFNTTPKPRQIVWVMQRHKSGSAARAYLIKYSAWTFVDVDQM